MPKTAKYPQTQDFSILQQQITQTKRCDYTVDEIKTVYSAEMNSGVYNQKQLPLMWLMKQLNKLDNDLVMQGVACGKKLKAYPQTLGTYNSIELGEVAEAVVNYILQGQARRTMQGIDLDARNNRLGITPPKITRGKKFEIKFCSSYSPYTLNKSKSKYTLIIACTYKDIHCYIINSAELNAKNSTKKRYSLSELANMDLVEWQALAEILQQ